MQITFDLKDIFPDQAETELHGYVRELARCTTELKKLVPENLSGTELENYIISDHPKIQDRVRRLLKTMREERREIDKFLDDIQEHVTQEVINQLAKQALGSQAEVEVPIEESDFELELGKILAAKIGR